MPTPTTLLLVDADVSERRQLAASLFSSGHYRVEEAGDPAAALACLRDELIDLVITDLRLPETDGCGLLELIDNEAHLATLPVMFLSDEDSVRDKVRALEAGAADYVTKPVAFAELCARIDAVLARHRADTQRMSRSRNYSLAGDFTGISFPELIGMLQVGGRSGRLAILTPRASGEVLWVDGMIYHAHFGSLDGESAFYRIMLEDRGQFEFEPRAYDLTSVRNTIAISPTALLMEGSRQLDSWLRDNGDSASATDDQPKALAERSEDIAAAPTPAPQHVAALEELVRDPEHKGRLQLIPRDELFAWNDAVDDETRCRVLLIGKPSEVVAALTSVAMPLTCTQIEGALHFDQRVLGLTFEGHGSRLDLLLLDDELPAFVLDELYHQPAVLVFAPVQGDGQTLALHSVGELEAVVAHLDPVDALCLGEESAVQVFRAIAERAGRDPEVHQLPASLAELRVRFRDCLAEIVRVWGTRVAVEMV